MAKLKETPSQTAGPFVHIGTLPEIAGLQAGPMPRNQLARADTLVERIRIRGTVIDGAGEPVKDAMIEIWQADANGQFGGNAFLGGGRAATDFQSGEYAFETIKPGPTPFHDGRLQAPHISVAIFARGINVHLQTRMYFPDEAANEADPVLQLASDRKSTLIAHAEANGGYRFDIRLQGDGETVFFDF